MANLIATLTGWATWIVHAYVTKLPELLHSFAMAITMTGAVLLIDLLVLGWHGSSLKNVLVNWRSARNDVFALILNVTRVGTIIGIVMLLGVPFSLRIGVQHLFGDTLKLPIAHPVLIIIAYYAVLDFFQYWFHRMAHHLPLLWSVHKYHHSSPVMNVVNSDRVHPIETSFLGLYYIIPYLFLPVPTEYLFVAVVLIRGLGLLNHSNVPWDFGWIGRYVIQSPVGHRLHHSSAVQHYNRNFAPVFQLWDVLFGTACRDTCPSTIGIDDDCGTQRPFRYVLSIYRDFLIELGRLAKPLALLLPGRGLARYPHDNEP